MPEVLTQTPWTVRYLMYRCVPPPPGAEDFGHFNRFPFLVPGSEFISTFILETPDADLLRDGRRLYY